MLELLAVLFISGVGFSQVEVVRPGICTQLLRSRGGGGGGGGKPNYHIIMLFVGLA